jgi:hypothetical protein
MGDSEIHLQDFFPLVVHDDYPISMIMMMTIFPVTVVVTIVSVVAFGNFEEAELGIKFNSINWAGWGFIW